MNLNYMQLLEDIFTLFSHLLEIYGALIIIFSGTFFSLISSGQAKTGNR